MTNLLIPFRLLFRFLCPNYTAFDQESQTCADWDDVDCEPATLYYASDNFDLYRIGSGLESVHYDSLRSDAEPQDHLQRSESNDPVRSAANNLNRVTPTHAPAPSSNSRDILRGSSSSNFYNSRNNVRDEDYDTDKTYRDEPIIEPKKKPGVRKLARKQQLNTNNNNNIVASSTAAPSSTVNYDNSNYNNNNNRNYYNHPRNPPTYDTTTTARPTQDYNNDNNNYSNNNRNYNHRTYETTTTVRPTQDYNNQRNVNQNQNTQKYNAPSTFRPQTTQQFSTYQAPSTTVRTTAYNNYNQNQNTNYQAVPTTVKPFQFNQNFQQATSPKPTTYNQNYQDNYGSNGQYNNNQKVQYNQASRAQPTTIAPTTNYQQSDFTGFQQKNYNNIQRSTTTYPITTAGTTFYDAYNANNQFTGKTNGVTKNAQTTNNKSYQTFSTGIYVPTTYAPVTKKVSEGALRGGDRYNTQDSDDGQYFDKSQKSTTFFDVTKAPKKVAQYNNYDSTGKYFEASTINYDFGRSAAIGFSPSSINLLAETPKTTTPVPR